MHIVTSTDILLPRAEDMGAWSVIACDQFTSEPEYWAAAEARAAEKPSTLSLMLPEAWLHTARADGADGRIADTMRRYLAEGVFQTVPDSFIYVERTLSDGRVRCGLVAALDLEQYDFTGTQRASVRSTEGTVEERLRAARNAAYAPSDGRPDRQCPVPRGKGEGHTGKGLRF